ncbi:chaplin [Streptomyces sp. NPDC048197]|uniref:chaplin n=1 Tax=Streptomyces sp. NPDC048197 TaxID=3365511 RepID=UPI0037114D7D
MTALAALAAGTAVCGTSAAFADSNAAGGAVGSPGVVSGNLIQVPIHIPINVCGNTVDIVGLLNPAFGNNCLNGSERGVVIHRVVKHYHHDFKAKHKKGHHGKSGSKHHSHSK